MFAEYRDQPLSPTLYSVAARIFIKLPFVKVPVKESSLKPLDIYVKEALAEKKLTGLHLKIFNASASGIEADKLIETLIHEEMEKYPASRLKISSHLKIHLLIFDLPP
ncbi:hypothetical protein AAC723_27760 (plasmid) [Klebsiella pneumoniae]